MFIFRYLMLSFQLNYLKTSILYTLMSNLVFVSLKLFIEHLIFLNTLKVYFGDFFRSVIWRLFP